MSATISDSVSVFTFLLRLRNLGNSVYGAGKCLSAEKLHGVVGKVDDEIL